MDNIVAGTGDGPDRNAAYCLETGEDGPVTYTASVPDYDDLLYHNAASCPDCYGGMIRQGGCCFCPRCGFESCGM